MVNSACKCKFHMRFKLLVFTYFLYVLHVYQLWDHFSVLNHKTYFWVTQEADKTIFSLRWVPFDVARPLLDRKAYVVLSEFSILQNGQSSPDAVAQNVLEFQHVDDGNEAFNDVPMDDSGEMVEPEDESSDDESGPETSDQTSPQIEKENLDDLLIGLRGNRLRYKVRIFSTWYHLVQRTTCSVL